MHLDKQKLETQLKPPSSPSTKSPQSQALSRCTYDLFSKRAQQPHAQHPQRFVPNPRLQSVSAGDRMRGTRIQVQRPDGQMLCKQMGISYRELAKPLRSRATSYAALSSPAEFRDPRLSTMWCSVPSTGIEVQQLISRCQTPKVSDMSFHLFLSAGKPIVKRYEIDPGHQPSRQTPVPVRLISHQHRRAMHLAPRPHPTCSTSTPLKVTAVRSKGIPGRDLVSESRKGATNAEQHGVVPRSRRASRAGSRRPLPR